MHALVENAHAPTLVKMPSGVALQSHVLGCQLVQTRDVLLPILGLVLWRKKYILIELP
jgi:hypothetical protein